MPDSDAATTAVSMAPESPLVACTLADRGDDVVNIAERAFLGHLNLRGDVADAVHAVFGLRLPAAANTMTRQGTAIALWLGPDEWLLVHSAEENREAVADLQRRSAGKHASVVDISSAQTLLQISGPGARELLARGCPLDLHHREFLPGQCAQSHFEHIGITLWLDSSAPDFEHSPWINVVVRRSFADYLYRLLDESAILVKLAMG